MRLQNISLRRLALLELGFKPEGRHFRHPEKPFLVEFLGPPLSIGATVVRKIAEIRASRRTLHLLSPTDCVKDRLAAFYFWNDRQALEQAVLVAFRQPGDLRDIKSWSRSEGLPERLAEFLRKLNERKKKRKARR